MKIKMNNVKIISNKNVHSILYSSVKSQENKWCRINNFIISDMVISGVVFQLLTTSFYIDGLLINNIKIRHDGDDEFVFGTSGNEIHITNSSIAMLEGNVGLYKLHHTKLYYIV